MDVREGSLNIYEAINYNIVEERNMFTSCLAAQPMIIKA